MVERNGSARQGWNYPKNREKWKMGRKSQLGLNLHDLFFFGFDYFVDSTDEIIRDLLHPLLTVLKIIRRDLFFLFQLFQALDGVASMVAERDTKFFTNFLDVLDQFLASLFG